MRSLVTLQWLRAPFLPGAMLATVPGVAGASTAFAQARLARARPGDVLRES